MSRKPVRELSLAQQLEAAAKSGLLPYRPAVRTDIDSLESRVATILGALNKSKEKDGNMTFFVMYDIENGKVRRYVAKYLQREGCHRIQKSIFMGDLPFDKYNMIRKDLTEVQSFYDNNDSIIIAPVPADYVKSMAIIGQELNLDLVLRTRNTLFF